MFSKHILLKAAPSATCSFLPCWGYSCVRWFSGAPQPHISRPVPLQSTPDKTTKISLPYTKLSNAFRLRLSHILVSISSQLIIYNSQFYNWFQYICNWFLNAQVMWTNSPCKNKITPGFLPPENLIGLNNCYCVFPSSFLCYVLKCTHRYYIVCFCFLFS